MFKALKYLFLTNLYKKAKKSFVMLFIYVVSLILFTLVVDDILNISTGIMIYIVLIVKWMVVLTLVSLIAFSILKIFNMASNPFVSKEKESKDSKKEKILSREKLSTKSDLILQKYMKD